VINLGAGPAEKLLRCQIAAIKTNIPGNYQIAVVGVRGGVGKTRITAGIGTAYASYRKEPVIAIDANPCYGSLGRVVDPSTPSTIREFLADTDFNSYPKARYYTGQNPQGLEVLAANQNVANPLYLSPQRFDAITARTHRFYQLALIDSGPLIEHPVMEAILGSADALVIVGTMNYDGAVAAETTINWLAAHNYHELLRRSALVLNDVYDCADKAFLTKVAETMGRRVGGVTTVPFDAHLRDGAVLDFDALQRKTRLAYIALAAWLAQGFQLVKAGAR
jgi:MinD-like ATPase involved in chromosome partitioning or flagellar assembly